MDIDTWEETYKPIKNPFDSNASFNGTMFETYGEEETHVYGVDYHYVWTYTADDTALIYNGRGFVNRMGYFITEVPWEDSDNIDINLED